ncbi:MAG: hypothetical protein UX45_C0033G0001 [Candidatus Uhrbacteria bacterium GW2011_GWF2_46_218]|uniref:Uncharacterized protein n=1 Tax=Candidatus Uhrbacteria bacterium GW2011_GWF2_46_218 TaxID=1619001 RepID=A0A0G1PDW4_9BACT|nr:MAG: hypothetical protein UX45_C0033G0001 [Candidatus Uhrbacteria bacterium GW2011_GWF2_46_218]
MAQPKNKTSQPANQPKPAQKAKQLEKLPVENVKYDRYTGLKFLELSETKLTEAQIKELAELEVELKAASGFVPVRTVRAAINNEQVLLVQGIPVPAAVSNLVPEKNFLYYFGVKKK